MPDQRVSLEDVLDDNPSLRPLVSERLPRAYQLGRLLAVKETGLTEASIPVECPYSAAQVMDVGLYPS